MNTIHTHTVEIAGKTLTLETGLMAHQASGSASARIGDTLMFSAVTASKKVREGIDYFPLQVEYREKFYAVGRFPGGFFKREARPSEREILIARLTDRPIRPAFPKGYHNELQILNTLLSGDGEHDPDILSVIAASTALTLSELPFIGPLGAVRVGRVEGEFVINPTHEQRAESDLDLLYCGNREYPIMIEGGANEVSEEDMVAAMRLAHEQVVKIIDAQLELRSKVGLPVKVVEDPAEPHPMTATLNEIGGADLRQALQIADKQERGTAVSEIKATMEAKLVEANPDATAEDFRAAFDDLEIDIVRSIVLDDGKRIDGRDFDTVRELQADVGLLPRTHGSALFSRGETQALATLTLGTMRDTQSMDAVGGGADEKSFMLHYNFPPYCVGETGRLGSTSRREIGHGALAERALAPVVPEDYPYTVRLVSEIMGSNGSSSMASCCVGCLCLMDGGVPIKAPVAGISVGLFARGDQAHLVTDILGTEDHCGDMDFKVAGTRKGITAFQVDLKIRGLPWDLVEGAFAKAKTARGQILDFMESVLPAPREELSRYAPRITTVHIDPEKIGELIGPGGKNIRRITEMTGTQIDISDDGSVRIFATGPDELAAAEEAVTASVGEAEIGMIYNGKVTGIKEFGAFVEILPGKDGLVHISEMADGRVGSVEDICKMGDQMWVKCIGIDDRGKIRLSRREALRDRKEQGEDDG